MNAKDVQQTKDPKVSKIDFIFDKDELAKLALQLKVASMSN
jgi:hypothetical protein